MSVASNTRLATLLRCGGLTALAPPSSAATAPADPEQLDELVRETAILVNLQTVREVSGNPRTSVRLVLDQRGDVDLRVVDAAGRRVRTWNLRPPPAGSRSLVWSGEDDRGRTGASGTDWVSIVGAPGHDAITVTLLE